MTHYILRIISHDVTMQQSLERQRQLNDYESKHGGRAVYGVNKFSDLTPEEFKSE